VPADFEVIMRHGEVAAWAKTRRFAASQFARVAHSAEGKTILRNFVVHIRLRPGLDRPTSL